MKIRAVSANNRKAQLELTVRSGKTYSLPYSRLDPRPTLRNKIQTVRVDDELGREAVTYVLASGEEGSAHIDHALEYNEDPTLLSELMVHRLTVAARAHIGRSGLSRREVARRLGTSIPQLYRLLDTTNTRKSINQLVALLRVLGCNVDLVIKHKRAA